MAQTIKFANGAVYEPINVIRYTEFIRGEDRICLDVVFDGDSYTYEELEQVYNDASNFKTIVITDSTTDEEGNIQQSEFTYSDFDIPVSISKMKSNDYTTITLKVSQKTVTEVQQDQLIQDNLDTQMAVLELAARVSEMSAPETTTQEVE